MPTGLRIIGGRLKGRRLATLPGRMVRPTSDRLRETLFNILDCRLVGARVLDGCAGTGALGIEALSRGASEVVFVERSERVAVNLQRNIELCGLLGVAQLVVGSLPAVATRQELGEAFDLILLDPPYEAPEIGAILSAMTRSLRENGTIVLERSRRVSVEHSADLNPVRSLKSGDSVLDFYQLRKKACDE